MAPCRDRNPTPICFEERRIQGLFGLKTTLLLVLKQSRAGARFWGRFQTLKQRRLFYAGSVQTLQYTFCRHFVNGVFFGKMKF